MVKSCYYYLEYAYILLFIVFLIYCLSANIKTLNLYAKMMKKLYILHDLRGE